MKIGTSSPIVRPSLASSDSTPPHPLAARAAIVNCPLLITGPTGSGKGYLARWIHEHSSRAAGPMIPVNCGAIPENLVDSHLFGHAKGSFSGAAGEHLGLVRAAQGGTLLLDEISELPASAQVRLLRLLEEREVQPVGYCRPVVVNVRIIAATNADLWQAVQRGCFREDLYFRLDVLKLHMKPLKDRRSEIEPLLYEFNSEFARMYGRAEFGFTREATQLFMKHAWPGNVRELRTVIERLYVLCTSDQRVIDRDAAQQYGQLPRESSSRHATAGALCLTSVKLEAVTQMINACRGNVSRAASELGVHRSTLYRWLAEQSASAA